MGLVLRDLGNEYCVYDALLQISLEYPITSYLEVGTRYGDSLLRVLAARKLNRICIADNWHESYFGPNHNGTGFDRSHKHVERMLQAFGYDTEKQVIWLDGDSAKTIPLLNPKKQQFDLVLVDGDHDPVPARTDVFNCWPLVAPGGFLVFDDILDAQHMSELWTLFASQQKDITENLIRTNKKFGVAVAHKEQHALETSKVRARILHYFRDGEGIDIGSSRDPLTRGCVAFDKPEFAHYPEVTHTGDARDLPFGDASFDWIWSSHCLEDIEDTRATLAEWLRVLRPGGVMGLYVPHPKLYRGTNTEHKHPGFTPEELSEMLIDLGAETIEAMVDDEPFGPQPRYSSLVIARKS